MNKLKKYLSLENLIYSAVFLLPTYLIRFKIFGLPTNLLEILIGIIFAVWSWGWVKNKKYPDFFGMLDKKYFLAMSLIAAGMLISVFSNPGWMRGLGIVKSWFLFPIIFFLIALDAIKKEDTKKVFSSYYFSSFFVALISLFYLISGKLTYDLRLEAFFNSPNYLAMFLAPAIVITLAQTKKSKFFIFSLAPILAAFYFTYSYAAWISVIISAAVILAMQKRISFRKIILFFGIITLIFLTQIKSSKIKNIVNFEPRSSLSSRAMIWKSSVKMLKNNWAAGIGPGNFQNTYLEYQKYFPPYLEWAVPHPHNIFLTFWLSGGIMGIAGFLLLIYLFSRGIIMNLSSVETLRRGVSTEVLYISLGIMLYILLHGLADTTYFKNDLAVVFWLCFLALKNKF